MKLPSWPSVIVGAVTAVFLAVVFFIFFSLRNRVELVAPDYYAQSLQHQDHLDAVRRASRLTPRPLVNLEGNVVRIQVASHPGATGSVYLYRPSDAKLDQTLEVALDTEGRQSLDLSGLAAGLWRIQVRWTYSNETFLVEQPLVL